MCCLPAWVCVCICVQPRCSLRGPWSASDSSISHVHCASRSRVTFLKRVCEFSCVTWTTISTFCQQCVKSLVNVILSSNFSFEAVTLHKTKMRVFPHCVSPKKMTKNRLRSVYTRWQLFSISCGSNAQHLENMNQIQQVMFFFFF